MNENETEIIFLIDRSGSMNVCEDDTIGGYNSFLERQKKDKPGAFVTTVLFDNRYEIFCEHEAISEARFLTRDEYFARGSTALLDAIGRTIESAINRQSKTLMVIITDGLDNSSKIYHIKKICEMIHERESNGWEFIFLGADMESVRTAHSIGISRSGLIMKNSYGIRRKFDGISRTVSHFRETGEINGDWKE